MAGASRYNKYGGKGFNIETNKQTNIQTNKLSDNQSNTKVNHPAVLMGDFKHFRVVLAGNNQIL